MSRLVKSAEYGGDGESWRKEDKIIRTDGEGSRGKVRRYKSAISESKILTLS